MVVTKHLTGRKTPPNFRLTLACLAFPIAAGDSDTCLGLGRLIGAGVWGQQKVCDCVRADGRTVRDAVLYSQEGRQRSGIKAPTDSPPSSVSGDIQRS